MENKNRLSFFQRILSESKNDFDHEPDKKKETRKEQGEQKEIIRRLRIQNTKLQEQLTNIKNKIKQANSEKTKLTNIMNHTIELNHLLADALGSCSNCWGEDHDCPVCSGNGIAGWRKINKRLFNVYVLPALEKLYGLSRKIK